MVEQDASAEPGGDVDRQGRKVGEWVEADPHGGRMSGTYREGERDGVWRHWFRDGGLRSEGSYRAGVLDGPWVWYRSGGGLLQRGGFREGEKHGLWERWDAQGRPLDRGEFDRGAKSGEWTVLNPDGTVRRVSRHRGRRPDADQT